MLTGYDSNTICACSTPPGLGALALVRVSGEKAIDLVNECFNRDLKKLKSHTACFGILEKKGEKLDEVVITLFRNPRSFTGEDTVEIACHGSTYIQQTLLQWLIEGGARLAQPGEFSLRAFGNGKMDLSQAEAVADLIASSSKAAHKLAMQQMRGDFSTEIDLLREQLIHFASLIELELDFAEEDVEFANRDQLEKLLGKIKFKIEHLMESFALGNAIKSGWPVAIVGAPNVGKSTLLNALLNEERAIVSEIPGTTRDTVEDRMVIAGSEFRFIDTAGIRETQDSVEVIGIAKTQKAIEEAAVVFYVMDSIKANLSEDIALFNQQKKDAHNKNKWIIPIFNKIDETRTSAQEMSTLQDAIFISAKQKKNLEKLKNVLTAFVGTQKELSSDTVVTNVRHYEALTKANDALNEVQAGLQNNISGDLLAVHIRACLHHLGSIIGKVTTDDLLGNIFSRFCIGK